MLRHKNIDRVCCIALALTLLIAALFVGAADAGLIAGDGSIGYEQRLFDQSHVHTIDILMDDWDAFLDAATSEEYAACHLIIDGESYKNAAIRGKGNTSLSSVAAYGNDRYSFKVEFDHYQAGSTYHGLDKLSLNNLIQDNTYMKDYFAYTLMGKLGVAAPLCSFVQINVNGEPWGLYLAVEGVEDAFLQRSYGKTHGELYKPDSMSFGGGRGNGRDFDMDQIMKDADFTVPNEMPAMGGMQPSGGFGGPMGGNTPPQSMPGNGGNAQFGGGRMKGMDGGMGSEDVKLQYIDDDPSSYANIFDNAKTDISEADQARLIAALKAMNAGDTSVIDTDAVIRYMAVHNFLCNDDSYTGTMVHNYYLYEENGVLSMIPWDYNLAYGTMSSADAASAVNADIDTLVTGGAAADRPMASWITASEEYTAQYHAAYQELLSSVFDSGWFAREIDRVTALIAPYVQSDPTAFCTYEEFQTGAATLRQFCLLRAQSVANQLSGSSERVNASAIDLSSMGTMNHGDGPGDDRGGFGRDKTGFGGRQGADIARTEQPAPPSSAIPQPDASPQAVPWLCACMALLLIGLFIGTMYRSSR